MPCLQLFILCCVLLVEIILCQNQKIYEVKYPVLLANYTGVPSNDVLPLHPARPEVKFYDYELDSVRHEPVVLRCFTCHYTKRESYDFGMANCDDPFDSRGIPVVYCEGGFCAVTRSVLAGYETYMVVRSCLPNCKNMYDAHTRVECCFGNLCNGVRNAGQRWSADGQMLLAAAWVVSILSTGRSLTPSCNVKS